VHAADPTEAQVAEPVEATVKVQSEEQDSSACGGQGEEDMMDAPVGVQQKTKKKGGEQAQLVAKHIFLTSLRL